MIDDQRGTPINPYESPRAELGTEESVPGPARVYGLTRPIHVRGKLTAEDVRDCFRRTPWEKVKSVFWGLVYLAAVAVIAINWFLEPTLPSPFTVLLVVLMFAFPIVWLLAHLASRRYPESVERREVPKEMTFSEDGLSIESEEGKTAFRWAAFSHCQCKDRAVSLHLDGGGDLICPKRFFADETEWQTFVGLVRCKLPDHGNAARKSSRGRRGSLVVEVPGDDVGGEADERTESGPSIRARGVLSWEDWQEIRRTTRDPWRERALSAGCLILVVGFLAIVAREMRDELPPWLNDMLFWGITLFLFVGAVILPPLKLRQQWKRREGPFAPHEVRVGEGGVEFIAPTSRATVAWSGFANFTQSDRLLLLYQARHPVVRWISRSLFSSDEDWETLLRLVREKLPERGGETAAQP